MGKTRSIDAASEAAPLFHNMVGREDNYCSDDYKENYRMLNIPGVLLTHPRYHWYEDCGFNISQNYW
jgi:hypothetical protein